MNDQELELLKNELSAETELRISAEKIIEQLQLFEKGISPLKLVEPCTINNGIKIIPQVQRQYYIYNYIEALNEGRIIKFVPASGAATRMFQKLISALNKLEKNNLDEIIELAGSGDEDCKASLEFFNNLKEFAFYKELKLVSSRVGKNIDELIARNELTEIIRLVVYTDGLNYANLPKGCIPFHSYPDSARTAFEEHIVESMNYAASKDKVVRVHFTISPEHETSIKKLINSIIEKYQEAGWKFDIEFSFQSPQTDTISVTLENKLFRDESGCLVLRPGGHGALLKNLNDLKADIISIKNIDNVVPDHLKNETYKYKKILGGYLIVLQKKIFEILRTIEEQITDENLIDDVIKFIRNEFDIDLNIKLKDQALTEKKKYLFEFLNRPIRVCGMVKREDHPGGSPFWVEGIDGELTKQIVETAQVDDSDLNQKKIFNDGTHFNPVDLVCGVKDYKGEHFNLEKFSNPDTGLISLKSKEGRKLKALELPGLWNGGMYFWLTIFVEVPKVTFNPVKEINDLLKPEHSLPKKK